VNSTIEDERADERARLILVREVQLQVARASLALMRGDLLATGVHLQNAQLTLLALSEGRERDG
jgi:hypothetical protein